MSKQSLLVRVEPEHHTRVKVFVPWQRKDWIQQIKSLPNRAWNKKQQYWSVPKNEATFQALTQLFGKELKIAASLIIPKAIPVVAKKSVIILPDNCIMATPEHLASSKAAYQKEKPIIPISEKELPAANFFKTIQQGERTFKVFIGKKIILQKANEAWLRLWVAYDKKGWIEVVKNIPGRKWETEGKYWLIPNVKDSYRLLKNHIGMIHLAFQFKISAAIPEAFVPSKKVLDKKGPFKKSFFEQLTAPQQVAIQKTIERLILERLSYSTQKTYKHHLAGLFYFYKTILPEEISKEQVEQYLLHQIKFKKIAESTQNQIISAVKAYWEKLLKRDKTWLNIQRPKKPKQLPNVLSKEEIIRLLNSVENQKHKLILLLIYASGLRLGEVVKLLNRDINISRRHIHIKGGKGKKDRYVALAETVLPFLEAYKQQYKPSYWLFEGQYGGQYSKRSVQNIFKKAVKLSKVNAYATVHTLRHSYATHCVEDGHNLKAVQDALGHASPETTQIYLHLSAKTLQQLKSPIDSLKINKK